MALNPWKVILATLVIVCFSSLGLLKFTSEADGWKLYLPEGSRHSIVQNWKKDHFTEDTRGTVTLFTHKENVLTAEGLLLLYDLHEEVRSAQFEGQNYTHACLRIPITNIRLNDDKKRRKRMALGTDSETPLEIVNSKNDPQYEDYFNFYGGEESTNEDDSDYDDESVENLPREIYCDIVETLEEKCGEYSLLEIWKYDKQTISKLTTQDIIDAINTVNESPVFGYETDYTSYLGQVTYNTSGQVVNAKSIRSIWLEQFDPENIPKSSKLFGFEIHPADPFTISYEKEVLKVMKRWRDELEVKDKDYSFFMNLPISFPEEASGPFEYDIARQVYGYIIMFLYTLLTLGKLNMVEHKFYLAAAGISSVFFGFISAIGITMALGFQYCPQHGLLPFICLGIGIDDMFVIMRCFNNIPEAEREKNGLVKNMGQTMRYAGCSITVTSLTDVCVFAIGALTKFPSIQSFSVAGAIAIAIIFIFQSSWFIAWMVLDQHRIQQRRDGFLPFIVHEDWEPPKWSQKDIGGDIMRKVAPVFKSFIFQSVIILITASMCAMGIWGTYNLQVNYDPITLLPKDSYLRLWLDQNEVDFPTDGWGVNFYTQDIAYTLDDFEKIDKIVNNLDNLTRTQGHLVHYGKKLPKTVQSMFETATGFWWQDFKTFIAEYKAHKDWREALNMGIFPLYLSDFLYHKDGSIYNDNFKFSADIICNMEAPPITSVRLGTLKFRDLKGPTQHLPAQHAVNKILTDANLSNTTFAYSVIYPAWEIEEIMLDEMHRNISMALLSVLLIVFLIMFDFRICFLVLSCVMLTLIDVAGITYILGMTLDPFYLMDLIIGVGLSVDYAVHIAHSFVAHEGSKKQRATSGFIAISPAVLHGAATTFLAITLLVFSESHLFSIFFNIISLTVVLGLYHGLFYLPTMLVLIGADKEQTINDDEDTQDAKEKCSNNGTDNLSFKQDDSGTNVRVNGSTA